MIVIRALVLENGEILLKEVEMPDLQPGEVLIRVNLAGICSTDLEMTRGYIPFSGILGHEFVGTVEKDPLGELEGKRVVGEINIGCGDCYYCRKGIKNHCQERRVLGIRQRPGAFAEFLALPRENVFPVPEVITNEEAVFTEPLAAGFQVLEQVHIPPSCSVAVLGDGRLGLLLAMVLVESGLQPVILGHHRDKMEVVASLGIKGFIAEDFGDKVDFVIECTGKTNGLQLAQELVSPRGTIVLKSTVKGKISLDMASLVTGEITVVGSRCGPFPPALRLLKGKSLPLEKMVEKKFPLSRGREGVKYASRKGVKKVVLEISG